MIHRLMSEEEMRYVHTVAIVLNCREDSPLHRDIFDENQETSSFINKLDNKAEDKMGDDEEGDVNAQ